MVASSLIASERNIRPWPPATVAALVGLGLLVGGCGTRTLDCAKGSCDQICDEGDRCEFTCDGGECDQICERDAECTLTCDGGQCDQECKPGSTCETSCTGESCSVNCDSADCSSIDG